MTFLKISLTPLDKFFFGGEVVFGGEDAQGERQRSYLVHSNILPQQTSLLGLLREQLLAQNGLLHPWKPPKTEADAIALVNDKGFEVLFEPGSVQADIHPEHFGVIEELSPLFLEDEYGMRWQPAPLDDQLMPKNGKTEKVPMEFGWDESPGRPKLENLNQKEPLYLHFSNGSNDRKRLENFFVEIKQVGITVTNRNKNVVNQTDDNEEAFYWQTFLRNYHSNYAASLPYKNELWQGETPFSFVFFAKMTAAFSEYKLENAQVALGGERSAFDMKVEEVKGLTSFEDLFHTTKYLHTKIDSAIENDFQRIVLMSDGFADCQKLNQLCALAVMETVSFRFFTTTLGKTEKFYDFKAGNHRGRRQSNLFTLLRRGSVLYVHKNNLTKVEDLLKNQTAFRQIGYNYFKTI